MTVGPSVFQIRTLWRCSLGLSGVHLTEVIPSRQHKRRMWWTELLFQSRCFQVDTTEAETTFCHWGPTNRDCAVMMWPQTDPRVEAINSNYTPHLQSTGLFLFLKVVILPLGMFSLNCLSLLHFKLIADFLLTDQLQSYWLSCGDSSFGCLSTLFLWSLPRNVLLGPKPRWLTGSPKVHFQNCSFKR